MLDDVFMKKSFAIFNVNWRGYEKIIFLLDNFFIFIK
jgi:hypothetical protein